MAAVVFPGAAGVTHLEGGEDGAQQEVEDGRSRVTDPQTSLPTGLMAFSTLYLLRSLRWWLSAKRRELSIKSEYRGEQGFFVLFYFSLPR